MHELSIATNIVEIVKEYTDKEKASSVNEITIEVGIVSGIVVHALEFALEEAVKDTVLQNAKINILEISGKAKCNKCSHIFEINEIYTQCPKCLDFNSDIIQGKELKVKSIIIE